MRLTLKRLRDANGLTLREASRRSGIYINKIIAFEHYQKVPSHLEVIRLLKTYNCNFYEVFYLVFSDIDDHVCYEKEI